MISLILILLSSIAKVFMDLSSEDRFKNPWFNKTTGSENKYKFKPKWLFTTVLVFVTDFWHLMQFFFLNLIILSVVLYQPIINIYIDFIIFSISFRVLFELLYSSIKKKIKLWDLAIIIHFLV